jgi:hypothetical protein
VSTGFASAAEFWNTAYYTAKQVRSQKITNTVKKSPTKLFHPTEYFLIECSLLFINHECCNRIACFCCFSDTRIYSSELLYSNSVKHNTQVPCMIHPGACLRCGFQRSTHQSLSDRGLFPTTTSRSQSEVRTTISMYVQYVQYSIPFHLKGQNMWGKNDRTLINSTPLYCTAQRRGARCCLRHSRVGYISRSD